MNCPHCNTPILKDATFCSTCGKSIETINTDVNIPPPPPMGTPTVQTINRPSLEPEPKIIHQPTQLTQPSKPMTPQTPLTTQPSIPVTSQTTTPTQQVSPSVSVNPTPSVKPKINASNQPMGIIDYIIFIFSMIFAPIKTYEAYHEQIGKANNALIIAFMSIFTTASLLIAYLIIGVVKAYSYYEKRTIWRWENIEGFEILKSIFEVSLSIMFVVLVVSVCYYIISFFFGKENNYFKLLVVTSLQAIPVILVGFLMLLILNQTSADLIAIIYGITFIYSATLSYELMTRASAVEENNKCYYYVISFVASIAVIYFLYEKVLPLISSSAYNSISNLF